MTASEEGGDQAPDEVPPPTIIKIEDLADVRSPYSSLNGGKLSEPNAVGAFRLDSQYVSDHDGEGALIGKTLTDLTLVIDALAETQGQVRVGAFAFTHSMDVVFTTVGKVETTLQGSESNEMRAAERLKAILASRDGGVLSRLLKGSDDALVPRLEELLKLLFEHGATLDMQTPGAEPIRIASERAAALYAYIRSTEAIPPQHFTAAGRLVGAFSDTRDFKLRLDDPWRGKKVIEGKYPPELETPVERFFNQQVVAQVAFEEERRNVKASRFKFTLDGLDSPLLPTRLPEVD